MFVFLFKYFFSSLFYVFVVLCFFLCKGLVFLFLFDFFLKVSQVFFGFCVFFCFLTFFFVVLFFLYFFFLFVCFFSCFLGFSLVLMCVFLLTVWIFVGTRNANVLINKALEFLNNPLSKNGPRVFVKRKCRKSNQSWTNNFEHAGILKRQLQNGEVLTKRPTRNGHFGGQVAGFLCNCIEQRTELQFSMERCFSTH